MEPNGELELVFQGLTDESAETIHRFKLALIADLELAVDHAQALLQGVTSTVLRSPSQDELERARRILEKAGARVLIVYAADDRPVEERPVTSEAAEEFESEEESDAVEDTSSSSEVTDDEVMTFEFDDLDVAKKEPKTVREYTLEMDGDNDLEAAFPDHVVHPVVLPPAHSAPTESDLLLEVPEEEKDDEIDVLAKAVESNLPASPSTPSDADLSLGPAPQELTARSMAESSSELAFDDLSLNPLPEPSGSAKAQPETAASPLQEPLPTPPASVPIEPSSDLTFESSDPAPPRPKPALLMEEPTAHPPTADESLESVLESPPQALVVDSPTPPHPAPPPPLAAPPEPPKLAVSAPVAPAPPKRESKPPPPEQLDAEASHEDDKEDDRPHKGQRRRSSRGSSDDSFSKLQLFGIFIAGAGLLSLVNWLTAPKPPQPILPNLSLTSIDSADTQASNKPLPPTPAKTVISGVGTDKDLNFKLSLTIAKEALTARLQAAGTNKPVQTAEQIANNVPAPPWINRIDTDPWFLQSTDQNEWSGSTTAFVYVEYRSKKFRLPATARIKALLDGEKNGGTADMEVVLSPQGDVALPADNQLIEALSDQTFKIYTHVEIPIKREVIGNESSPPSQPTKAAAAAK